MHAPPPLRQPGSRAQKLRALPFELAVDVVSATALVVGSVRAKRIVL